jgi:hypothetical protein
METLNIVMHAGKDAYHFARAKDEFDEKDHLLAIAAELYKTEKYPNYPTAMAAAVGIYDYHSGLLIGELINRSARMSLQLERKVASEKVLHEQVV